jgi:hypothetical protein
MDLQKIVNLINETAKITSAKEYNLGKFIGDLEKLEQEKEIIIEDGVYPDFFDSWRGSYCELALNYGEKKTCVKDILKKAKEALDYTMTGYKGGDFVMDKNTPIHIANYGECNFIHKKYEKGMLYNDSYCPEKKDSENNFMIHYSVKLIGIEKLENCYKLKLRIDE